MVFVDTRSTLTVTNDVGLRVLEVTSSSFRIRNRGTTEVGSGSIKVGSKGRDKRQKRRVSLK